MNVFNNLKIGVKLTGGFLLVALVIAVVAAVGYTNMQAINVRAVSMYEDRTLPIQQLGAEDTALYTLRGDLYKSLAVPAQRDEAFSAIQDDITTLEKQQALYEASFMKANEKRNPTISMRYGYPIKRTSRPPSTPLKPETWPASSRA